MPLHLSATEKQAFERAAILDSLRQALHTKRCARMKTDVFLSTAKLPTNKTRRTFTQTSLSLRCVCDS